VSLPLLYNHADPKTAQEGEARARLILDQVGLGDRMSHQPHELSGGQQQRVAIARAMVNDPVVVIADEPTGNLDSRSGEEIMELLHKLHERGTSIVMVTHDPKIAAHTQRTVHLIDGLVDNSVHNGKNHTEKQVQHETV
jgi:putative ABC transport system ATP-binding protein